MAEQHEQVMQCMEVWGGNRVVDQSVVMAGLDAWVYSKPHGGSEGGGDLHYVSSCATGRITRLLIADVSGHGEIVSETASTLRDLMRRYVNYIDQSRFVRAMNAQFAELSEVGMFATSIVTTFFAPTNELYLCNAGHPPPLVYRRKTKRWAWLDAGDDTDNGATLTNIPLGIIEGTDYPQFDLRLGVGDLVLCYTDSLIESHASNGNMLGQAGLLRILETIDVDDPGTIIAQLLDAITTEADGNLTDDDVTVLLFRPNGLAQKVPFLRRVAAPLRVIGSTIRSIFPGGGPAPWPEMTLRNMGVGIFDQTPRQ
jgi:hypothetical protein